MKKLTAQILEFFNKLLGKRSDLTPQVSISEAYASQTAHTAHAIRAKKIDKPRFEKYYPYALAIWVGFLLAQLVVLMIRPYMLPTQAPPMIAQKVKTAPFRLRGDYNAITDRNIFNSDGVIPPALMKEGESSESLDNNIATLSNLPLSLIGTIVHVNPAKSVAAIQNKSSNAVLPYLPNDDIDSMATLIKVERGKAIFRNNRTGRLEYIEIPNDSKISFTVNKPVQTASGVMKKSATEFTLRRDDLNKHLKNLPELLQQARAIPNQIPGSNEIDGFKLIEVQPNSIYTDLGLSIGDVVKEVNGQKVNSPAKAMELYNQLRNEGSFQIVINRDGQDVTMSYSVE